MDRGIRELLEELQDMLDELNSLRELKVLYDASQDRVEELEEEVADLNNKLDIIDMEGL